MNPARQLLDYNQRGALANLLAIEEHLQQQPTGPAPWCVQKHALLACDHHLAEAVNHASRIDSQLAQHYRQLRGRAEAILTPAAPGARPDLQAVAKLRNDLRIGLAATGPSCSVCDLDRSGLGDWTIPDWQQKLHWWTELASVVAVPWVFAAAAKAREPHRSRLRLLGWGMIVVDGFLLLRWLGLRKS